ncbi:MAG: DMT family transporter [Candidatus Tectimicrobiota bacterium]
MTYTVHALALAGALCSASATILIRQGLGRSNPYAGFWINLLVGVIGIWIATWCIVPRSGFNASALPFFIASGFLGTVAGRFLRFVSIDKVGAPVAAAINNLNPFISTALAIVLLGERVTVPIIAGTSVIVLGTILLSLSGRYVGFRPAHLVYPFLSASCFGAVAIVRKLGLTHAHPVFGFAVNVSTAFIAFTAYLIASHKLPSLHCDARSWRYFLAAGVTENAGVLLGLIALGLGQVSVVTPLNGTSPLFVLLLSFVCLRGIEPLSSRIVLGTLLIVAGVFLLTAG